MKVRIIKGTNQIGGCITEIKSKEAKIIIDFGEDLPDDNKPFIPKEIEGLTKGKASYDAVFITHSHSDHIGIIPNILKDIPVYVEKDSQKIYELLCDFTYKKAKTDTILFNFEEKIKIKDITVTPYIVDHSSYNSAMFLIECEGKKILHTGDYRSHGRKGKIFEKNLKKIGNIDLLITEGTSFERKEVIYEKEEDLEKKAFEIFKKYNQVFILQSSTNIDRIVSFYKARDDKKFIEDLFTASLTIGLKNIPDPKKFKDVGVWFSKRQMKRKNKYQKYMKELESYNQRTNKFVYQDYIMLVKNSMIEDIKLLKDKGCITNACLVYSMWDGYLEKDDFKNFISEIKNLGINLEFIHTSGHADIETIKLVNQIVKPKQIIPIHTTNKNKALEIFENSIILDDNEEIEI